ncbi:MAG: hypothetical protein K9N35_02020 [Candidatus Marinimicrobia bacterium]|nr:hypothetical protein [Candidatus Neomarinimicrobiota bacterium]
MIDIHNHILPAVDDGAQDLETAFAMLQEAVGQGVEQIVLTPHLYEADIVNGTGEWKKKIDHASDLLFGLVEKHSLPIKIVVAAEVRYQELMPVILDELKVILGGKYVLLEFPFQIVPKNLTRIIYEITVKGFTPIIAHPERIKPWQNDPGSMEELLNMGCPFQVDIGSFLGKLGPSAEKLSKLLIERDAIHIAGSDSHGIHQRPLYSKAGYDWLSERYSIEYADLLLKINPAKVLAGDNIQVYPVNLDPPPLSLRDRVMSFLK